MCCELCCELYREFLTVRGPGGPPDPRRRCPEQRVVATTCRICVPSGTALQAGGRRCDPGPLHSETHGLVVSLRRGLFVPATRVMNRRQAPPPAAAASSRASGCETCSTRTCAELPPRTPRTHRARGVLDRNVRNLASNTILAWRLIRRMRPAVAISTGAGVAVPFLWLARLHGARVIYIESFARTDGLSLTARLVRPVDRGQPPAHQSRVGHTVPPDLPVHRR